MVKDSTQSLKLKNFVTPYTDVGWTTLFKPLTSDLTDVSRGWLIHHLFFASDNVSNKIDRQYKDVTSRATMYPKENNYSVKTINILVRNNTVRILWHFSCRF